jgi:hypothetical protein
MNKLKKINEELKLAKSILLENYDLIMEDGIKLSKEKYDFINKVKGGK